MILEKVLCAFFIVITAIPAYAGANAVSSDPAFELTVEKALKKEKTTAANDLQVDQSACVVQEFKQLDVPTKLNDFIFHVKVGCKLKTGEESHKVYRVEAQINETRAPDEAPVEVKDI